VRREPERTCVGCRGRAPQRELIRIAPTPDGVVLDRTHRAPGRGAHLHRDPGCVAAAAKRGALGHALRISIAPDEVSNLLRDIEEMGAS